MVVVKVSLGEDIRRFSLSALPSFAELRGMLEKLFDTPISGVYEVKYLDPENDQITVSSDAELVDAFGMSPVVGDHKQLRLYLVPKGTNPSLMASVVPSNNKGPVTAEIDLTSLLSTLGASSSSGNAGQQGNPLMNLLTNLLASSNNNNNGNNQTSSPQAACPWLNRPEEGNRVHMYYVCDGCEVNPISGNLYQCDVCPDYHLCEKCRDAGVHLDKNHSFTVNPPRRTCGAGNRWGRGSRGYHGHGGHHHSPKHSPQQAPQQAPVAVPASSPVSNVPVSPFANPANVTAVPITKPPVPVVSSPHSTPVKPIGIVETTGTKPVAAIVPQVQVVPSERLEMSFLSDVTMPDGSEVSASETFNKVWRLSNSGFNTWPLGCRLSLESNTGERLSSVENIEIPGEVPPGSAVTISVEMEAPKKAGRHVSYWRMHGPSGQSFGNRIWVDIISIEKKVDPVVVLPSAPVHIAPEPAVKPGEQYATQLENLYRMGFLNVDLNRHLLEASKGNVSSVIDQLCAHQN
jgi:next-to-BRCA1 protein 1